MQHNTKDGVGATGATATSPVVLLGAVLGSTSTSGTIWDPQNGQLL